MPTPAAPARFVAYMSTTAIASTGGTFTPRGEHKSASHYLIRWAVAGSSDVDSGVERSLDVSGSADWVEPV